ncbi:hypothetical protein DFR76_1182 [Nocardia pseudobrasiliensis]|uniref:Uncharacterized protein n=2 Tax=Nocardia pseudobrasiliensis TaxID=45979 RepID=A0A370HLZ1_9NOCA|nr:hypothetical protein DFR76_1182 [Nocardia pseudobrasiliensis]
MNEPMDSRPALTLVTGADVAPPSEDGIPSKYGYPPDEDRYDRFGRLLPSWGIYDRRKVKNNGGGNWRAWYTDTDAQRFTQDFRLQRDAQDWASGHAEALYQFSYDDYLQQATAEEIRRDLFARRHKMLRGWKGFHGGHDLHAARRNNYGYGHETPRGILVAVWTAARAVTVRYRDDRGKIRTAGPGMTCNIRDNFLEVLSPSGGPGAVMTRIHIDSVLSIEVFADDNWDHMRETPRATSGRS